VIGKGLLNSTKGPDADIMKTIHVVAAIIVKDSRALAARRGYGNYKDWWEFPGGKIKPGESPESALAREIREELRAEIRIGSLFCTVSYDYPEFHMEMQCYLCELVSDEIVLVEHEDARWLSADEMEDVRWLPSDIKPVKKLKELLRAGRQEAR